MNRNDNRFLKSDSDKLKSNAHRTMCRVLYLNSFIQLEAVVNESRHNDVSAKMSRPKKGMSAEQKCA